MMDSVGVYNAMMDYADNNGDQAMMEQFKIWLHNNLGGDWEIRRGKPDDKMARLETLVEIAEVIADVSEKRMKKMIDIDPLSEIMRQITLKFKEAKWDYTPQSK